jgi:CubicO group peptidase (beta-lactamase class C family)
MTDVGPGTGDTGAGGPFAPAARVLAEGLAQGAFPAAVAEVGTTAGVRWQGTFGRLSDAPDAPDASLDTVFDLASLTKPLATTTLVMRLADAGRLVLADPVSRWCPQWRGTDRAGVTVHDLLAHASGLTAHLPLYRDCLGRREFEPAICALPLEYAPRTRSIYSDLGFILLGFLTADAAGRPLEDQFEEVRALLDVEDLCFRPPRSWRPRLAPAGLDPWRGRVLVGEVQDGNAWALGGVAGHAGLFGTAPAVGRFARDILALLRGERGAPLATPERVRQFAARTAVPGSSRALGWDTMLPTSSCGTRMHPTAIGHTGFTGTSLWIDAHHDVYAVLLTNRVHPNESNDAVLGIRPRFHDAVMAGIATGS